jgi:hypothetical protein
LLKMAARSAAKAGSIFTASSTSEKIRASAVGVILVGWLVGFGYAGGVTV